MKSKIVSWINSHRNEVIILSLILIVGAFLRLYRIDEYMVYLGDEGRDALIVRRLLVNLDPILIGPRTSVGDMYLGPLYYYFIAPGLLLFDFSPVGPSVQIAIFGVITIAAVWWVGRTMFGKYAGLIAASLFAVSPTVVNFSRSSWNPNIMPLLSLLVIFSVWKIYKNLEYKWLIILGVLYAFVLQSHYLGLLLLPFILFFLALSFIKSRNNQQLSSFIKFSVIGLVCFLLLMSPLLLFDIRHGWINLSGVRDLVFGGGTGSSSFDTDFIPRLLPTLNIVATRLLAGHDVAIGGVSAAFLLGISSLLLKRKSAELMFLYSWLLIGVLGLSLYRNEIYDHYMGFIFPAPFLLFGGVAQILIDKAKIRGTWLVVTSMLFLIVPSVMNSHLKHPPNGLMRRTEKIANEVVIETNGRAFNFALISKNNYEEAYLYFMEKENANVVLIDSQRWEETVTDQLFVVCELENKDECSPTSNAKAQVANFGWSKIDKQWDTEGIRIYKLSHTEQEQ